MICILSISSVDENLRGADLLALQLKMLQLRTLQSNSLNAVLPEHVLGSAVPQTTRRNPCLLASWCSAWYLCSGWLQVHRGVYVAAEILYERFKPMVEEQLASSPFAKVAFTVSLPTT